MQVPRFSAEKYGYGPPQPSSEDRSPYPPGAPVDGFAPPAAGLGVQRVAPGERHRAGAADGRAGGAWSGAEGGGIEKRAGQLYARIAAHWDEVREHCSSIRRADVFLRRPRPRIGPFLWSDWLEMYAASKLDPITDYVGLDGITKSALVEDE